ncbi:MAG: Exodeoxyribonuclease VII large subunit [Rhodanobacteraceae bacterium]|jgi:exodeoxyribonuclease VII large subunit|nr:MAG: Exodeoxyribonuclease VII large subunit [Rhodanobacteraceae bacterium]
MMAIDISRPDARKVLTPSALNRLVRELIEDVLPLVWIEGEICNFVRASSGHWYFSLKDAAAEVRCAMFARENARLTFRAANGARVLAHARVTVYEARGSYQLVVEHMEDAGEGALRRAFEQLKAKLEAEGLFDAARKRPLPAFPRRIGVITSASGAAIRDVLSVARRRFVLTEIEVLPVLVQGAGAPEQIAAMLRKAARSNRYDLLLVTRGGGSLEDLAAFNDEGVARAIVASPVPVVSAVGHEIDFSISDFVADLRAPTPSAAAERMLPDGDALRRTLAQYDARLRHAWLRRAHNVVQHLDHLATRLNTQSPRQRLASGRERMDAVRERLLRARALMHERASSRIAQLHVRLLHQHPRARVEQLARNTNELRRRLGAGWARDAERRWSHLAELARALNAVSPLDVLKRGYAILFDESGRVLRSATGVRADERVRARLADGELALKVEGTDTQH